ncbi:MAG: UvrD-helicase domain-containing protein [Polyangiaceae bacterium]
MLEGQVVALLNPAQQKAVEHQNGPLLVLAGAGSGKTRVITHRIARLMERGVPASAIVALTFTNKAAGEMAERVHDLLGKTRKSESKSSGGSGRPSARPGARATNSVTISTFHSFGLNVLSREKKAAGSAFTIFDQGDCMGVVKEILKSVDVGKRFDVPAILARISNAKNAFMRPEELPDHEGDDYAEITKEVFPRYQSALKSFSAFDFDDLVCEVGRLWEARPDVLERWQERYRYILVDEYQDTNGAQLKLLRQLADKHKNICVVGDDDQAIYGWRGADVRNILAFEDHFAGAEVVKLEENYRSCKAIIDVANAVISKRTDNRHQKVLTTSRMGEETVTLVVAPAPEAEAEWIAADMRRRIRDENIRQKNMAVLYRSNGQAKAIEDALRAEGVGYRLVGGQQFYERKEVKDLLGYLKIAINRHDEISLRRILNYPARGIGEQSVERLALHALAKGWTLWQAVERVDALDDISGAAREGCRDLEKIIGELRKKILIDQMPASEAARGLAERIGLRADLDSGAGTTSTAAAKRWGNVEALFQTFARREAREVAADGPNRERSLETFLNALTLDFSEQEEVSSDLVTLSTLHGAKGLEFDIVYLIGCEEGLLPHARTIDSRATDAAPADLEEERRLFYVGVTRAKDTLLLSRCKTRGMRGKAVERTPSRFLSDIPPERAIEKIVSGAPKMGTDQMAANANALLAALDALE